MALLEEWRAYAYDQQADKFGDVDFPAAELSQVHAFLKELPSQILGVIHPGHSDKREPPEMGVDQHTTSACSTFAMMSFTSSLMTQRPSF